MACGRCNSKFACLIKVCKTLLDRLPFFLVPVCLGTHVSSPSLFFVHAIQCGTRSSQHRSTTCKYHLSSYTYCSVKLLHAANIKPSCTCMLSPSVLFCTCKRRPIQLSYGPWTRGPKMGRNECIHYPSGAQKLNTLNMRRPFLDLACTSSKSYDVINTHAAMGQGPNLDELIQSNPIESSKLSLSLSHTHNPWRRGWQLFVQSHSIFQNFVLVDMYVL
jgi:hypothetical protein